SCSSLGSRYCGLAPVGRNCLDFIVRGCGRRSSSAREMLVGQEQGINSSARRGCEGNGFIRERDGPDVSHKTGAQIKRSFVFPFMEQRRCEIGPPFQAARISQGFSSGVERDSYSSKWPDIKKLILGEEQIHV